MSLSGSPASLLNNPELFKQAAYIGGKWIGATHPDKINVINPATQQLLGCIPCLSAIEVQEAVHAASEALSNWSSLTAKQRSRLLLQWYSLILANLDDLALILTLEQGKPLLEAKAEIAGTAAFVEWFAGEAKRVYGKTILGGSPEQRGLVLKQPIGVCSAITPWNFPSAMITRKVSPALAAGCTIIVKPAEATPFSALALALLAEQAGIPAGVLNIVTGDPHKVGLELTQQAAIRKFSFTGSTKVGKQLMAQCASTVKKVSLELGGNAPFIVFEDADIEKALVGAVRAKFVNAGQICIAVNRFYVHEKVLTRFTEGLKQAVLRLKVGAGTELESQIGPLINEAAVTKIEALIEDAKQKGANIILGGKRHALGGSFFEPTIITHVTPDMELAQVEIFGPIASIISFKTDDEVIAAANHTEYGLASYLYSQNINRVWRTAEALEAGMIGINSVSVSNESTPFGGVKQSGIGREGATDGIDEYLTVKYLDISLS